MIRLALAALCSLVLATYVHADAEADYKSGMESWERGDFFAAIPAFKRAADAGHVESLSMLGSIHDAAEQDDIAIGYYRKAVAAGSLEGMFGLAKMLEAGEGAPKDIVEARRLFLRAAEAGHNWSVLVIAQAYIRGQLGVTEEERRSADARKWIQMASDDNWPVAMEALESAHRTGAFGFPVDAVAAAALKARLDALKPAEAKKRRRR